MYFINHEVLIFEFDHKGTKIILNTKAFQAKKRTAEGAGKKFPKRLEIAFGIECGTMYFL